MLTLSDAKLLIEPYTPCVYIWKRDGEVFYVGSTSCLKNRLSGHSLINKLYWMDGDELEVIQCRNINEARDKERDLIRELNPKYNKGRDTPKPAPVNNIIDGIFIRVKGDFVRTIEQ